MRQNNKIKFPFIFIWEVVVSNPGYYIDSIGSHFSKRRRRRSQLPIITQGRRHLLIIASSSSSTPMKSFHNSKKTAVFLCTSNFPIIFFTFSFRLKITRIKNELMLLKSYRRHFFSGRRGVRLIYFTLILIAWTLAGKFSFFEVILSPRNKTRQWRQFNVH